MNCALGLIPHVNLESVLHEYALMPYHRINYLWHFNLGHLDVTRDICDIYNILFSCAVTLTDIDSNTLCNRRIGIAEVSVSLVFLTIISHGKTAGSTSCSPARNILIEKYWRTCDWIKYIYERPPKKLPGSQSRPNLGVNQSITHCSICWSPTHF